MNRRLLTWINLLGVASLASSAAHAEVKIAMVDFNRAMQEFYRYETELKNIQDRDKEAKGKLEERFTKGKELKGQLDEQEKKIKDPTLSADKKDGARKEAGEIVAKLSSLQKEAIELQAKESAEIGKLAQQTQISVTKEIWEMIGKIAEEKGLDLVFNRSFGMYGVPASLAYSSTKNLEDFTDELVKRLNKGAPAGWKPSVKSSEGKSK